MCLQAVTGALAMTGMLQVAAAGAVVGASATGLAAWRLMKMLGEETSELASTEGLDRVYREVYHVELGRVRGNAAKQVRIH